MDLHETTLSTVRNQDYPVRIRWGLVFLKMRAFIANRPTSENLGTKTCYILTLRLRIAQDVPRDDISFEYSIILKV